MVDGHSHLTLPGGSHWIDRGSDPTQTLLAVAEANGELQHRSGVRWARDVGSPRRDDGGVERALSIGVRDRWRGRRDRPYVRAAGTWITARGLLPAGLSVEAGDADEPWQALASVTWRGGELLGEPDAGVVREGGPADFSLVHGDPLSDPTAMWRVWRVA